jgi:hypothetical protein
MKRKSLIMGITILAFLICSTSLVKGYVLCGISWNWQGGTPRTVHFRVNGNCLDASAGSAQNQIDVIQRADSTWGNAGANFQFMYDGTHSNTSPSQNGVNEVMWRNQSGGGALATTSIWYSGSNMQECDMVFWDMGITWHGGTGAPPSNMYDIQSVATHEFGHFLCLDHTPYSYCVMYYAFASGEMRRNLCSDDSAGINAIYPVPYPPPQNLVAQDGYDEQVPLSWQRPSSAFPSRYRIYRSDSGSGGPYVLVDSTVSGETSLTNYGLTNGVTYWYKATSVYYYYPPTESQFSNADDGTPAAQAVISTNFDTLNFGNVLVNHSLTLPLMVYNIGSLTLNVTDITIGSPTYRPYFTFSDTVFSIAPDDSFQITVTFTPTQPQSYNCNFGIFNNSLVHLYMVGILAQGVLTGVSESQTELIPQAFSLEQNHPNPFNPETEIAFSIPYPSIVKFSVYNIMGQKVATLVDGTIGVGNYQVKWNASDMPSGIYFYRLTSGSTILTRKMILLR